GRCRRAQGGAVCPGPEGFGGLREFEADRSTLCFARSGFGDSGFRGWMPGRSGLFRVIRGGRRSGLFADIRGRDPLSREDGGCVDLDEHIRVGHAVDDEAGAGGGMFAEILGDDGVDGLAVGAGGDVGGELDDAGEVAGYDGLALQAEAGLAGEVDGVPGDDDSRIPAGALVASIGRRRLWDTGALLLPVAGQPSNISAEATSMRLFSGSRKNIWGYP
ncbi:MAG TPA: hypothetical protein DDZ83_05530, partial [Nitrospinae bacterium]|nr:hypothetical protein [Nitrospinota bacterium]